MMESQPNYYSIIPADVRYDKNLKANEKLLYGEITALSNSYGYCWANNHYFSELYGVNKKTVSVWISNLEKQGYIRTEIEYHQGTNRVYRRLIYIVQPQPVDDREPIHEKDPIHENVETYPRKDGGGYPQKDGDPIHEKMEDSITRTNTTRTNTKKEYIVHSSDDESNTSKPSEKELKERFEMIWKEYPNKKGKVKAFRSYKSAIKKGVEDIDILKGIGLYKKHLEKNEWLSPANGSTWFNQNRWEDEYEIDLERSEDKDFDEMDFLKSLEG